MKNWEIEASFKTDIADWRTIDQANYTFSVNGGPPQSAEHMLSVGTYNALIAPNEFYGSEHADFASSHKTFKRMMPAFAWEVLEVYGGPPVVAIKWRHWGVMKRDYSSLNEYGPPPQPFPLFLEGVPTHFHIIPLLSKPPLTREFYSKGEKVTAPAHGKTIDIQGVTIARVNAAMQIQSIETFFDPLEMFRQIAPNGELTKATAASSEGTEEETAGDAGEGGACPFLPAKKD